MHEKVQNEINQMKHSMKSFYCILLPCLLAVSVSFQVRAQPIIFEDFKVVQLAKDFQHMANPVFSSDASILYFEAGTPGLSQIMGIGLEEPDFVFQLSSDKDKLHMPAPHPDNERMIAVSQFSGKHKVHIISSNTSGLDKILTRKVELLWPAFNSSGNLLSFAGKQENNTHYQLMTYDFVYDNLNLLTSSNQDIAYPRWSPSGSYISYHHLNEYGRSAGNIQIVYWDGLPWKTIHNDSLSLSDACWGKSKQKIICTAYGSAGYWLLMINIQDGSIRPLVFSKNEIKTPAWSPDSEKVAFILQDDHSRTKLYVLFLN